MSESAAGRGRPTQLRIKHTKREREGRERDLSAIFLCSSAQPVRPGGLAGIATPKGFLTREGCGFGVVGSGWGGEITG